MVSAGDTANQSTKTIHHHHHQILFKMNKAITKPFWGPFKTGATTKMSNLDPPAPYVTVSHFFYYTPSPNVMRHIMTKFFLDQGP